MKLSIIIPTYNTSSTVIDCLTSVQSAFVGQHIDLEIIVVDDGSHDSTLSKVKNFANTQQSVKCVIIENEHGGVSVARNTGIQHATGDYLMFVDSDDALLLFEDDVLMLLNRGDDLIFFESGEDRIGVGAESRAEIMKTITGLTPLKFRFGPVAKFYRRQFILENNLLFNTNLRIGEDLVFNLEALSLYQQMSCYKTLVYQYNPSTSTFLFKPENLKNEQIFKKEVKRIIDAVNEDVSIYDIETRLGQTGFFFLVDRYYAPAIIYKHTTFMQARKELALIFKQEYQSYFKTDKFDSLFAKKGRLCRKLLAHNGVSLTLLIDLLYILHKKNIKK